MLYRLLAARHRPRTDTLTRRELLARSLALSSGLMLSCSASRSAGGGKPAGRVVVVGAGFSGLACAFELLSRGYEVTVLEARRRVGGRVLSFGDFVPGRNVEGGGELIGSNHPIWVGYAQRFGLEFLDVPEEAESDFPIRLGAELLSFEDSAELWAEIEAAQARLTSLATSVEADVPWNTPGAQALDARSLGDWLAEQDLSPRGKHAFDAEMSANNGVALARQSLLANLVCIQAAGGEAYWSESEVYRCAGGNQRLAQHLAEELGERVRLGAPVTSIELRDDVALVSSADGARLECEDVVLSTPPPTWRAIEVSPALPQALQPQMGSNVKFLSHVRSHFWRGPAGQISQYALTDGDVAMTWDATEGQPGEDACLTAFSGGPAAERVRARAAQERAAEYTAELEACFPGYEEQRLATRFMDWPSEEWTGAGYSFPAPGEVTRLGPILASAHRERLHFAGEHCCVQFVGYMEGALQSGVRVARRLAQRDGREV